jgi:L-fuculose-phosphate aldolase
MPSSESIIHQLIYGENKEINAVFHGHNDLIVAYAKKTGLTVTEKEFESGTVELAKEVLKVLADKKLIVLKNHGFICMGKTMKEAGELTLITLKSSEEANERIIQNKV